MFKKPQQQIVVERQTVGRVAGRLGARDCRAASPVFPAVFLILCLFLGKPAPAIATPADGAGSAPATAATTAPSAGDAKAGETLYNGIVLPATWPPKLAALPDQLPVPPYLQSPPAVIPIDVGRQLFIDDFLVAQTDMTRTYHRPVYHPSNPVIRPDRPWEMQGPGPMAMPYSGGVWVDPADGKFKLWYMGGYVRDLCLAESTDGVVWTKPDYGVEAGTNKVIPGGCPESSTLWMDLSAAEPAAKRFKYFIFGGPGEGWHMNYRTSADGIHWGNFLWPKGSGQCGDRTTVFYNPFREKWVFIIRGQPPREGRIKQYWEADNVNDPASAQWPSVTTAQAAVPLWVRSDLGLDVPEPAIGIMPQLYNLDCVAYESVVLGFFSITHGEYAGDAKGDDGRIVQPGRPKGNQVKIGFSRDGFHWQRPDHTPFMGISDTVESWNWGNVQPVGNGGLVVGDRLYFYVGGRKGKADDRLESSWAGGSTGLAVLRRDGFASMDAGDAEKTLTTRNIRFGGKYMFVNVDAPQGALAVEVLSADGQVVAPFNKANCQAVSVNKTLQAVTWRGAADLSTLAGQDVKLRFHLTNGKLYSFWVTPDATGASHGYVMGGGPGFKGHTDTVGAGSYSANHAPWARTALEEITERDTDGDGTQPISLDASASADGDGTIASYAWLIEGKSIAAGATARPSLKVGAHTVTLAVTDNQGAQGFHAVQVRVLPQKDPVPPTDRLAVWLKADTITGLEDGAPVTRWLDSSPNKIDPYQDKESKQPVFRAKAAGGRPAVHFDGVDDLLKTQPYRGLMQTSYDGTFFVVFKPEKTPEPRALLSHDFTTLSVAGPDGSAAYQVMLFQPGGKSVIDATLSTAKGAVPPDAWHTLTLVRSGDKAGQFHMYVDGTPNDNNVAMPYHREGNEVYGLIGAGRMEKTPFKGDLAELIIYSRALSDAERQAVENYLAEKYGLKSSTPR